MRVCGGVSSRPQGPVPHGRTVALPRPCGHGFYRADAFFTMSVGTCGRGRTSRDTFSSKNVHYDISSDTVFMKSIISLHTDQDKIPDLLRHVRSPVSTFEHGLLT
jgi:hypothetical protein